MCLVIFEHTNNEVLSRCENSSEPIQHVIVAKLAFHDATVQQILKIKIVISVRGKQNYATYAILQNLGFLMIKLSEKQFDFVPFLDNLVSVIFDDCVISRLLVPKNSDLKIAYQKVYIKLSVLKIASFEVLQALNPFDGVTFGVRIFVKTEFIKHCNQTKDVWVSLLDVSPDVYKFILMLVIQFQ